MIRPTYRKHPEYKHLWEGVLKDENNNIVWTCGHAHRNRDQDTIVMGKLLHKSCVNCAWEEKRRRERLVDKTSHLPAGL